MASTLSHVDRVALITGGASGIGRACARLLAAEGAQVCLADLDGDAVTRVAKEIEAAGGRARGCEADVTDPDSNDRMVEEAKRFFGALHIAHLNAGVILPSTILDGDIGVWDRVLAVNLRGVFLGLRAAAPAIQAAGGGSIIVTASVSGLRGDRSMASYVASKHGVIGLVKAAAAELSEHAIRVNAVCPGAIDTPMTAGSDFDRSALARMHPLNRIGQREEVAALVSFLASDRASFITGAAIPVDGGITAVVGAAASSPPGEGAA